MNYEKHFTMLFSEFRFYVVQLLTINNINRKRTGYSFFFIANVVLYGKVERGGLFNGNVFVF